MNIFRSLCRTPGFLAAAVLTLALGIGGNVACFGVIRAVLLKPLRYRDPDRIVLISGGASPIHYSEIRSSGRQLSLIGAYAMEEDLAFAGGEMPEVLKTNRISENCLEILGVAPLLGHNLSARENTALISYDFWQRHFQGDLEVLGRSVALAGSSYLIAGVLPQNFAFPAAGIDIWLANPEDSPQFSAQSRALSPFLTVFGRLKDGVTLEQATAELIVLQRQYARDHPAMLDAKLKSPPAATPLQQAMVGHVQPALELLFGAVGLVLLIACANLATLLLARSARRSGEFAIRAALGASRATIAGRLLAETLILFLMGGAVGTFFAFLALSALRKSSVLDLPRISEVGIDWTVLAYAAAVSLFSGIVFGVAPSFTASQFDLMSVLRGRHAGIAHTGLRTFLVTVQIALSFVLLVGTTLLIKTILRLEAEPLGFEQRNLLTGRIALTTADNPRRFFEDLLERLAGLPGVEHVSASLSLPMTSYPGTPVQSANQPPLPLNQRPIAAVFIVTPDYFETLGIPLKQGRTFTKRDGEGEQRVAVIDENLARQFWPDYPEGQSPVGQRLLVGGVNKEPAEVIGIVGNVHQNLEGSGWNRSVYVPFAQSPVPTAMIALRAKAAMGYAAALRRSVQAIKSSQPVSDVRLMETLIDAELGSRRILMRLLACFASVTLVLVLVGIYGLTSYSVAQRTREMGIRRALGAPDRSVLGMIILEALRLAFLGIAAGLIAAIAGARVMTSYLFQTRAADPFVLILISGLFVLVTVAAAVGPALRAAEVHPIAALRYE